MSKHHINNLAEQIANKGYASAPFHQEKMYDESIYEVKTKETQAKDGDEDNYVKLKAYQIHLEKGGSELDNWLEAEQWLKNNYKAV